MPYLVQRLRKVQLVAVIAGAYPAQLLIPARSRSRSSTQQCEPSNTAASRVLLLVTPATLHPRHAR
jgi:hypothetical protein